jgi:hypothetical protein
VESGKEGEGEERRERGLRRFKKDESKGQKIRKVTEGVI